MGAEDSYDSSAHLTTPVEIKEGKRYYRKSQLIAWGILVIVAATVVGVLCGVLPECIEQPVKDPGDPIIGTKPQEPMTTRGTLPPQPATTRGTAEPPMPTTPGPCQGVWCDLRLPETLQAEHYILRLRPDLAAETYDGDVIIQITVTENMKYPRVHYKELTITNTVVRNSDGEELSIADTFYYAPNEFHVIEMEDELTPGDYEIELHFTNSLVGKIVGFYKSTYKNFADETRMLATSKFQPTDARRAFPCLDEPNFKASFTTTLEHNMGTEYKALSNMPDVETGPTDDGWGTYTLFEKSVKMSTYLAIFIVCDFEATTGTIASGKEFRVFAPPDKVEQTQYALDIGINITNYYEEYFDLAYPLPKLDMIAIPDFVSGAMEHWGLITYRERYLLYDPLESSASNKQRINTIVAHELAHMWFGNIVTMVWWDDLWLNEGFASYLEYLGAASAEPTWSMLDQFVTSEITYVFELDQIVSSHPIVVEVNNPDEINQIFDAISYSKGASVIRMMNYIIGDEAFREGLSIFLKRFQYGNAVSQDLWDALEEARPDVPVGDIMNTWTKQMGFPVVNLTRDGANVNAMQEWFLVDPKANKSADEYGSPYDYKWDIAFDYYFKSDPTVKEERMELTSVSFPWTGPTDEWYIANVGQTGYYRVNYDVETWNSLVNQLLTDHEMLSPADRAGLIDDAFNLARAENIDYTIALNLTKYLIAEEEYVPWDSAFGNIFWMGEMLRYRPCYGMFRKYIQAQSKPLFDNLRWNKPAEHLKIFLQSEIIDLSCGNGNPDCLEEGVDLFRRFIDGESLLPDLRSNAYQYGMQEDGDQDNWDYLWDQYQNTQSASEKSRLQFALARTREVWLLSRYIGYTEDESLIREQDYFNVMAYIADNPVGNPLVWDYVRENWQKMVDRFGLSNRYLGRLVPGITEYYATELKQEQMLSFFAEYPDAGAGETGRKQALERVQTNINWLSRNEGIIEAWLEENTMDL